MISLKNASGNHKILRIINDLLKKIGTDKNLITHEICEDIETNIEKKDDREVIDSLLWQLQIVNEQIENMRWLNKHYKILHDFAQVCSKTLNEDILLKKAYDMVSQVMATDSFYIALFDEKNKQIHFLIMLENGKVYPNKIVDIGDNYSSIVIETREIIHLKKASQAMESKAKFGEKESSSCIFVPVIIDDHVRGVISAQSFSDFAYRKEHEELLQIIGSQVFNSIETARLYEKIYIMSQTDELTSLKNHRAFHNDLSRIIMDQDQTIILMMIDSDNLKKVNDNFGHDIGDLYLQVVADGIKSVCSDHIIGYRYAGDEFMIIIKSIANIDVSELNDKLMEFYKQNPIFIAGNQLNISISSGVAFFPEHGFSVDTLKKSADKALYKAKEQGKNRMVTATN